LPELAEVAKLDAERTAVADRVRDAQILVDDLTREQKKADQDVETVKTRRQRDRTRMDQGLITNPKDLERMTHELASLERRISDLEDAELEVMERLEDAQTELDAATAALAAATDQRAAAVESRDKKATAFNEELAATAAARATTVQDMPEDLITLYERIRTQKGVGAAELRARQCQGCQLAINASELSVIAKSASDEVVRCEECSRILVRTGESGL
jgi:predicted  nucleic acid-binding Zn-ribbon protein